MDGMCPALSEGGSVREGCGTLRPRVLRSLHKTQKSSGSRFRVEGKIGGAEGDRTLDLLNAIQARSQLRYSPTRKSIVAEKGVTVNGIGRSGSLAVEQQKKKTSPAF